MSFKEVNALRKDGRLNEAYTMARKDWETQSDTWSASALFWVLNDISKAYIERDNIEKANMAYEMMKEISPSIDDEMGYVERTLRIMEKRMDVDANIFEEAEKIAKDGDLEEAFNRMFTRYRQSPLPKPCHDETYGWVLYKYFSKNQDSIKFNDINQYLNSYLALRNNRPSLLHSMIMVVALLSKERFKELNFKDFYDKWGHDKFRKEDWISTINEDFIYESLALKVANVLYEELDASCKESDLDELMKMFRKIVGLEPNNIFANRKLALLLGRCGKKEEALSIYRKLVSCSNNRYMWSEMALFVNETPLKMAFLSKALLMQPKEDFVGDVHLRLAECLIEQNDLQRAAVELNIYKKNRDKNKWKLSNLYVELLSKTENIIVIAKDNRDKYREWTSGLVDNRYKEKKIECNRKARSEIDNAKSIKIVFGNISVKQSKEKGKPDFGFIENCFIPPKLLMKYNIKSDCMGRAKAILTDDGKWRVVQLIIK